MLSTLRRATLVAVALTALLAAPAALAQTGDTASTARTPTETASAAATEEAITGRYTGVLVDPATTFPRDLAHHLEIDLERLTPRAELERMVAALEERGQDALDSELWNQEVGTVQIDNDLAHPIAAAFLMDGQRGIGHLVLVIDRPISIGEVFTSSRSMDYPFSVIEIDLENLEGGAEATSGEMMVAAQMDYVAGTLRIENLAFQPLRILSIEHTQPQNERQAKR